MIVNVGGYVFGYDAEDCMLLCFKNRRVRYSVEITEDMTREQFKWCCERLIPIIENVPDDYIDSMLELDDLLEGFVL